MEHPQPEQHVRAAGHVLPEPLGQRARGEERVPERGDGTADAQHQEAEERRRDQHADRSLFPEPRARRAPGPRAGQRHHREQEEGVDQMQAHHHRAGQRVVGPGEPQEHQRGADRPLEEDGDHPQRRPGADPVPAREGDEAPHRPSDDRQGDQGARDPVTELDEGLEGRRAGQHLAVADRPVRAAARAGPGGPHERPPHHHRQEEGDQAPGCTREAAVHHDDRAA